LPAPLPPRLRCTTYTPACAEDLPDAPLANALPFPLHRLERSATYRGCRSMNIGRTTEQDSARTAVSAERTTACCHHPGRFYYTMRSAEHCVLIFWFAFLSLIHLNILAPAAVCSFTAFFLPRTAPFTPLPAAPLNLYRTRLRYCRVMLHCLPPLRYRFRAYTLPLPHYLTSLRLRVGIYSSPLPLTHFVADRWNEHRDLLPAGSGLDAWNTRLHHLILWDWVECHSFSGYTAVLPPQDYHCLGWTIHATACLPLLPPLQLLPGPADSAAHCSYRRTPALLFAIPAEGRRLQYRLPRVMPPCSIALPLPAVTTNTAYTALFHYITPILPATCGGLAAWDSGFTPRLYMPCCACITSVPSFLIPLL